MSHIKGRDLQSLRRLIKAHGVENVIGETHEVAAQRNPRRRRRGARRIRQSLRVVARGMQRRVKRAFGGRGMKLNPSGLFGAWKIFDRGGQVGYSRTFYTSFGEPTTYFVKVVGAFRPPHGIRYDVSRDTGGYVGQARTRDGAFKMAAKHAKRMGFTAKSPENPRRNPHLAVVGALNPPLGRAMELRYHRTSGEHPGYYRHKFTAKATVFAMKDGSLRIVGR